MILELNLVIALGFLAMLLHSEVRYHCIVRRLKSKEDITLLKRRL